MLVPWSHHLYFWEKVKDIYFALEALMISALNVLPNKWWKEIRKTIWTTWTLPVMIQIQMQAQTQKQKWKKFPSEVIFFANQIKDLGWAVLLNFYAENVFTKFGQNLLKSTGSWDEHHFLKFCSKSVKPNQYSNKRTFSQIFGQNLWKSNGSWDEQCPPGVQRLPICMILSHPRTHPPHIHTIKKTFIKLGQSRPTLDCRARIQF